VVSGIIVASFSHERAGIGTAVAISGAVFLLRDSLVTYKRVKAEQAGLGIDTSAKWLGKIKTAGQIGALTLLSSPLVEVPAVSYASIGLIIGSAVVAIGSGIQYNHSFNEAMNDYYYKMKTKLRVISK